MTPAHDVPATADVLVVGAGVAGVCLAADLAARGASVVVIEATQICGGSSGLNAGGVRQQFSQPVNIGLAQRTVARLTRLSSEFGSALGYHQVGYLFMLSDPALVPAFTSAIQVQNGFGVPSRWLTVPEIVDLVPGVRPEGLIGGAYCPTDGHVDPNSLVTSVAGQARADGARIVTGTSVVGFDRSGDRVDAVRLGTGHVVSAGIVVNCAGAWADDVARLYGGSLPITPWRSQCYRATGLAGIPVGTPCAIDYDNGRTYVHYQSGEYIVGTDADTACPATWTVPFDASKIDVLVERLARRFHVEDAGIAGGWAGLLEVTADENPISDWTHFTNLYTMAGFSGHGLSIAPGLAEEVAALLTGGTPTIDLSPYAAGRFDPGRPAPVGEVMAMR